MAQKMKTLSTWKTGFRLGKTSSFLPAYSGSKIKLSLLVPCFNEEKRILKKFDQIYRFLASNVTSFEIILINDGSKDKTEEVLQKITKKYKKVFLIGYSPNKGKGFALKEGVKIAKGEVIGFTDADFAISLNKLPEVLELLNKNQADIVIGNRKSSQSNLKSKPDNIRRFLSFLHSQINNFLLDLGPVKDTLCGFKFFKRSVAKDLFSSIKIHRWFFDLEILIKAREKKLKIIQTPVSWEEVKGGQVKILNAIKTSLKEHLIIYSEFFNLRIFTVLILFLTFLILFPFFINPQSLTKRNGDYSDLVWPDYFFIRKTIVENKQIPLWNPTLFSGIPEVANPQSPLIYPPNFLAIIFPLDIAIVLLIFLHVLISAIYLFRFSKENLKWSNISSLVFALGISFSPFYWTKFSVGHLSMGFAMLLSGPILFYGYKVFEKFTVKNLILVTIFLSLQYLNYPTIWYYTLLFSVLTILFTSKDLRKTVLVVISGLLSLVLIAPIFLIQLQASSWITRSELSIVDLSVPIWSLKRFLASVLIPSNFLTKDLETEVWLYPSIFLILAALFGWFRARLKYKLASLLIFSLVVLITLGNRTPVFAILAKILPGFSFLRVSTRDWFIFIISSSFLAAWFIGKTHSRIKNLLVFMIVSDLIIFSILRIWFVPKIMSFQTSQNLDLLKSSANYRYYCTSRCISARDSLPLGINTADGYHLIILKNYRSALSQAGGYNPPSYTGNIPSPESFGAQPNALELGQFNVGFVLSSYPLADSAFTKLKTEDGFSLYKNTKALKRIRLINYPGEVTILINTPNYLKINTKSAQNTLVLADSFFPGWEVWVDKNQKKIKLYDSWAMSVDLESGDHLVEFFYRPFNHILER